ncbi:MAG TPA: DUF5715 family protein [Solirubrobacteraceae bacterium]
MTRTHPRRRTAALLALAVLLGISAALLLRAGGDDGRPPDDDPLRYRSAQRSTTEQRAALGASHVLFAKSPGGALATAARVAAWRPLVERAAGTAVSPDVLEAIVFLESAGRSNAQASNDLDGAVGLTQILAQTGRDLLGMKVDVRASERLTRGIARGRRVARRRALRMRVDERFDPRKALAATVRYLQIAKRELERDDLAVVSYHMGIGNLQRALGAYGEDDVPYAQLFFDSGPRRHAEAWEVLSALGDDSATYYWRVLAAARIMRLYRTNPAALRREQALQMQKGSAENLLRPPDATPFYADPFALGRARASGELVGLDGLGASSVRIDRRMGELAGRIQQSPRLYRALRPEALAVLRYIGRTVRQIAGGGSLVLTSTVRDTQYQRVLAARNSEATRAFSQHTTGYAFDIERDYDSRAQALAFQFVLDRLQAQNAIAWVREPAAIHITVGPDSRRLGL